MLTSSVVESVVVVSVVSLSVLMTSLLTGVLGSAFEAEVSVSFCVLLPQPVSAMATINAVIVKNFFIINILLYSATKVTRIEGLLCHVKIFLFVCKFFTK